MIDGAGLKKVNFVLMEKHRATMRARLLLALKRVDLKQADLAREMGVSPQNITHWMNRESVPSAKLFELCEILHCTPEWLLSGREDPPPDTSLMVKYRSAGQSRRLLVDVLLGLRPESDLDRGARVALDMAIKLCAPTDKSTTAAGVG